jgi:hypothetical protein
MRTGRAAQFADQPIYGNEFRGNDVQARKLGIDRYHVGRVAKGRAMAGERHNRGAVDAPSTLADLLLQRLLIKVLARGHVGLEVPKRIAHAARVVNRICELAHRQRLI